jgi:hypothetical protein
MERLHASVTVQKSRVVQSPVGTLDSDEENLPNFWLDLEKRYAMKCKDLVPTGNLRG